MNLFLHITEQSLTFLPFALGVGVVHFADVRLTADSNLRGFQKGATPYSYESTRLRRASQRILFGLLRIPMDLADQSTAGIRWPFLFIGR